MDPQPFPRRFPRKYQVDDEDHLQSRDTERNVVAARFEIFPNTSLTSRDSSAIDNSPLVTNMVTVNDNRELRSNA